MSADTLFQTYERCLPVDKAEAMQSYRRYHTIVKTIAERHGYTTMVGAAVFSALSPNNEYHQNIRDLETLLVNERAGRGIDDFSVTTYGQNKRKAWRIAKGELPSVEIVALKTWNFYNNVHTPDDPSYVTVDGHMYWCWQGIAGTVKGLRGQKRTTTGLRGTPSLTKTLYSEIAGDIRGLARALGVIPCQLQAILWVTWKRIHQRAISNQATFFPKDFEVAGIVNFGQTKRKQPQLKLRKLPAPKFIGVKTVDQQRTLKGLSSCRKKKPTRSLRIGNGKP